MDRAQKEKPTRSPASEGAAAVAAATSAFDALDAPGRHGVRIFALAHNEMVMVTVATALFVLPLAIMIGMMPFWEQVGGLAPIRTLNAIIAPAVESLSFEYRIDRFPLKRFLISCVSLVEIIFLSNIAALFSRRVRKHALLVWIYYDRRRLLQYAGISTFVFLAIWYLLFFDWTVASFLLSAPRGGGVIGYSLIAMPVVAFVFGHLAAIVGLGVWRTVSRKLQRRRAAQPLTPARHQPP